MPFGNSSGIHEEFLQKRFPSNISLRFFVRIRSVIPSKIFLPKLLLRVLQEFMLVTQVTTVSRNFYRKFARDDFRNFWKDFSPKISPRITTSFHPGNLLRNLQEIFFIIYSQVPFSISASDFYGYFCRYYSNNVSMNSSGNICRIP